MPTLKCDFNAPVKLSQLSKIWAFLIHFLQRLVQFLSFLYTQLIFIHFISVILKNLKGLHLWIVQSYSFLMTFEATQFWYSRFFKKMFFLVKNNIPLFDYETLNHKLSKSNFGKSGCLVEMDMTMYTFCNTNIFLSPE